LLRSSSDLPEGLTHRAGTCSQPRPRTSSLFGLAPCGVCPAHDITGVAVRSYRTFSPLPRPVKAEAVCFLWHFPSTGLNPASRLSRVLIAGGAVESISDFRRLSTHRRCLRINLLAASVLNLPAVPRNLPPTFVGSQSLRLPSIYFQFDGCRSSGVLEISVRFSPAFDSLAAFRTSSRLASGLDSSGVASSPPSGFRRSSNSWRPSKSPPDFHRVLTLPAVPRNLSPACAGLRFPGGLPNLLPTCVGS